MLYCGLSKVCLLQAKRCTLLLLQWKSLAMFILLITCEPSRADADARLPKHLDRTEESYLRLAGYAWTKLVRKLCIIITSIYQLFRSPIRYIG